MDISIESHTFPIYKLLSLLIEKKSVYIYAYIYICISQYKKFPYLPIV